MHVKLANPARLDGPVSRYKRQILALAIAVMVAGFPASGRAMLLPQGIAGDDGPVSTSMAMPSGGTVLRPAPLAIDTSATYVKKDPAHRPVRRVGDVARLPTGQIAWLGVLLVSMCGLAWYLGREFASADGPVRHRGKGRRNDAAWSSNSDCRVFDRGLAVG